MEPPLPERIKARLKAVGKSASAVSTEAGLGRTAVRDILSGRAKSPQLATLVRLSAPLDCTLGYLTGDSDDPVGDGPRFEAEYEPRLVRISDFLEAGVFRMSVWQRKDEDRPKAADIMYNDLRMVGWEFSLFEMKDNSMDAAHILNGDMITGAHGEITSKTIELTNGLMVIARFKVDQLEASETSLRQVEIVDGTIRLVTRSTTTNAKPIILGERNKSPKTADVNVYHVKPAGHVWIQAVAVRVSREIDIGNLGDYSLVRD